MREPFPSSRTSLDARRSGPCRFGIALLLLTASATALELRTNFSTPPPSWVVSRFPNVEVRDGALTLQRGKGHAASVGVPVQGQDLTLRQRIRISAGSTLSLRLEYGFNLHLCRILFTPEGIALRVDQPNGKKDGAEPVVLAESKTPLLPGVWHDLEWTVEGDLLSCRIGELTLSGRHPAVRLPKTSVIWALSKGSMAMDDLVIHAEAGELASRLPFSGGPRPIPVRSIPGGDNPDAEDAKQDPDRSLGIFTDYVEPILQTHCYDCHSHEAKKAKGGLVVDSLNPMLKGGDLGPALIPGDPEASLLYQAVLYHDVDLQMPPDSKLSETDVEYIREWIERGAAHPRSGPQVAEEAAVGPKAEDLWSVQPLTTATVPKVGQTDWPRGDVDRFILASMEAADLSPSPDAAAHQLLRRIHDVLTGLPPTARQVTAFLEGIAIDPDATLEATVDALMASRHFGERWGRHWLDVARYADVSGSTAPKPFRQAWRYRDYVVHSFNQDKPWDRFVREQLAGDLMEIEDPVKATEALIGTGYLALSHVLAVDRDKEKLKLDTIDEQLDVIGRTFMGVQIGCARCHDHKIDPFPTRDYYAMAGIFRSTETLKGNGSQEGLVPEGAALQGGVDAPQPWLRGGKGVRIHSASESSSPRDEPIHLRGEQDMLGEVVPRGFPTLISIEEGIEVDPSSSGRLQLADWLLHEDNPLPARLIVNRIWHHVFGQGLVRSTDNFGFTGDPPSHPELLDFLAHRFRHDHQSSFKSLIRELVLSRTFRQASTAREEAVAVDPENRLLWRAHLRRRDAESLIDSIQAVAGVLNLEPALHTTPDFKSGNQASTSDLEIDSSTLRKRALYWPVFRKDVPIAMDLLGLFDFPPATSPRGTRATTRVPSQSLALLNSSMVLDAARALQRKLPEASTEIRLERLYTRVLARPPTPAETEAARSFLEQFSRSLRESEAARPSNADSVAWNRLCHTLFVSNEFITIE